jgi:hypothetical protein
MCKGRGVPFATRYTCADKIQCELVGQRRNPAVLRLIHGQERVACTLDLRSLHINAHGDER